MKKFFSFSLALSVAISLTGCNVTDTSSEETYFDSGSNNSSGKDSLVIKQTDYDNFKITWDKKSSGYSEAVYGDYSQDRRGRYFLSSNSQTKQTLNCVAVSSDSYQIKYQCTNDNPEAPVYENVNFTFDSGKNYDFWVNQSTSLIKQGKVGSIQYDGNSQQVTIY